MGSITRPVTWFLALLLLLSTAFSTTIIANAKDWRVAYIIGLYAPEKNYNFVAIDSPATGREVIPYQIPKGEEVIVYESDDPQIPNYEAFLRGMGFTNVRTVHVGSAYDLMFSLPRDWDVGKNGYVLVPDSAGEWVLAAGPLAYVGGFTLYFLNNRTIDRILSTVPPDARIYIIGYQGKRLKEAYPNATFISSGAKAKDSILIAEEFKKIKPYSQVYVMSGLFLYGPERPDMPPVWTGRAGTGPVIISYVEGMPEYVKEFLDQDYIKTIIFIGPELDPQWKELRDTYAGRKNVLELMAVGYAGMPTRKPGELYPLPMFALPSASVIINAESMDALPQGILFIRLRNRGKAAGYASITYVEMNCGPTHIELKPTGVYFVDAGDSVLVELNAGTTLPVVECKALVVGRYGPDADRLFEDFNASLPFMPQPIKDDTQVDVVRAVYSPRLERFVLYVKNLSGTEAYVTAFLRGVLIDGVPTDLKSRQTRVPPNADAKIYVKAYLTDADLLDNPEVNIVLRYGKNPNLPIHMTVKTLPLEKETLTDIVLEFLSENALLVAAIVLILVILLILRRR